MTSQTVEFKPHFGAFVLETLTLGMYGESRNAIREYVQNGFDSLRHSIRVGLISETEAKIEVVLDVEKQTLVITDNGAGLRTESAVDVLASVGASNKNYRRNAGFRGIGRLAGIVFCDKLTFIAKAQGEPKKTMVVFDAKELRAKLSPHGDYSRDAAATLRSCVKASLEDASDRIEDHFFEVRLEGFFNPPLECQNLEHLRSFLSQVSPLPYRPDFGFRDEILAWADENGKELESIRLFVGDSEEDLEELFKPYGKDFGVKTQRVNLSGVDFVASPTGRWWGWVGRKRTPGSIKDDDAKGIRIRVRNIQIDGTDIMRDIFAVSRLSSKPRLSYARLVDWYPGEIFVSSEAAVPNARRDGFEEDGDWAIIRNELDVMVAEIYGKAAYRTSTADQLSVPNITKRLNRLAEVAEPMIAARMADWDKVSQALAEATEIQSRLKRAVKSAEDTELTDLRAISEKVSRLKFQMDTLAVEAPGQGGCEAEVATAVSDLTQRLYREFRARLPPTEWQRVRGILEDVTGEAPLD